MAGPEPDVSDQHNQGELGELTVSLVVGSSPLHKLFPRGEEDAEFSSGLIGDRELRELPSRRHTSPLVVNARASVNAAKRTVPAAVAPSIAFAQSNWLAGAPRG